MADYAIHEETLTDVADVIRKKDGTSALIDPADYADRINLMGMLEEKTASGAIATFADGADTVPLKKCEITLPTSLDGYTEVDVVATGKNLIDGTDFTRGFPSTTIGASIDTISSSTRYAYFGTAIKGGVYTVSSVSNDADYYNAVLIFGYTNGVLSFYSNMAVNASRTVDLYACDYARIAIGSRTGQITVPTDFTNYGTIQFEIGSSATTYEPYSPITTHTATLGRTIYGGSVDVVNGQGESGYKGFSLSSLTWSGGIIGGNWVWYADLSAEGLKLPLNSNIFEGIADPYTPIRYNGVSSNTDTIALRDNGYLYVNNGSNTIEPSGNVTIALATPETFTFDPVPIDSKLGNNTLWSEQGSDTEVTYRSQGTAVPVQPTLVTKTITENGTYNASSDNADGYSSVTVNVPTGGEEIPFTHVFTAGTATDQYYTATEDGIYLAVGIRDQSTGCSINLPDGGTTLLTSSLLSNRAQMKVVQLTSGQRIHLSLYDSSHMRGGWVFKLNTTTPVLSYSNGYSSSPISNHGTTDKVLSVIALAPYTDNTTIWDKTMKCYVRGTYSVSNRYSWLRLMYGIDNEMPTISFSGGIGGQWLINLG